MSTQSLGEHYLENALRTFRDYKSVAERAMAQTTEEHFFHKLDEGSNSIAIIVKHVAGNMLSRWTDFLTTDGEKPERNRDLEFEMLPDTTKDEMLAYWEKGWSVTLAAIEPLTPDDLLRTITIRGQSHTVIQAITRQVAHYANHVGQIVFLAKHFAGSSWQSVSVPKNKSAQFNAYLKEKLAPADADSATPQLDVVMDFAAKQTQ